MVLGGLKNTEILIMQEQETLQQKMLPSQLVILCFLLFDFYIMVSFTKNVT